MNIDLFAKRSLLIMLCFLSLFVTSLAQWQAWGQETAERKLLTRVAPEYPDALRKNFIGGMVRIEVVVTASGTVEKTELLGGNPILGQAAMKAIQQWKYAPGPAKDKLVVKVDFDPRASN